MIENLQNKTANEIRDLAVADFNLLSDALRELKTYQLRQVGKTLAVPRYTVSPKDTLLSDILKELAGEESEYAGALLPATVPMMVEEAPMVTFQLLTSISLEEYSYPGNVTLKDVLKDLGLSNKSIAIKGELIPSSRLSNTLERLEVDGAIVAAITKTANA